MAARSTSTTVLGKRKHVPQSPTLDTRKRRATRSAVNDENADPALLCDGDESAQVSGCEELENPFLSPAPKGFSKSASSSAKTAVKRAKIATLPGRINGHFKVAKNTSSTVGKTQLPTPQTPRHEDVLSKFATPRHKVQVTAKLPLTPQTPWTPRTPSQGSATLYSAARQLFVRSAQPCRLVGRESEVAELEAFLDTGIQSKTGRCLYISGPPGTGKSAFVGQVLEKVKETSQAKTASMNCMSIKSSKDVYSKIIEEFGGQAPQTEAQGMATLKAMFFPKKQSDDDVYVLTLDEIDHLLTLDLEILYALFEWALNRSSRLLLIGIANALDLTDRFLPRLKARGLKPQLLPFVPYTAPQIVSVVTERLRSLSSDPDYVPFVHPMAIQFCAKKVASQTGDLRKAFDLIRRIIDVVEMETKAALSKAQSSPLGENPNLSSPCSSARASATEDPLAHLTPQTAPRATIAHASRISASAFNNGTVSRLKNINLQQKAALCSLLALEKKAAAQCKRVATAAATPSKSNTRLPTVRRLHEMYGMLCRREGKLAVLQRGEFADVISSLEVAGLVKVVEVKGKAMKGRREEMGVSALVSEMEVKGCLEGVVGGLLSGLLQGDNF